MPGNRPLVLVIAAVGMLSGCAYYNGLYNANRLAGDAEKAARAGRSGEARSLWAQVAVKAESVAVRHTTSRYRDDAFLLMGRALREAGQCNRAVAPLTAAVDSSDDPVLRDEARLIMGQCWVLLRQPDSSWTALSPLVARAESPLAQQALVWRGRGQLERGAYHSALDDLKRVRRGAVAFDLALAFAGLDSIAQALRILDSRVAGSYEEDRWREVLDTLGRLDPEAVSWVVDRLGARPDLTAGQRARLFLDDGTRWARVADQARAAARFRAAFAAAPDSADGATAEAELALAVLRGAGGFGQLADLLGSLEAAARRGGVAARMAAPVVELLQDAIYVLGQPETPHADLLMFVIAEEVRDLLGAPRLAAAMFRRLQRDYPTSSIAPKALLAAAALEPELAPASFTLLRSEYPGSPYTLALQGAASAAFTAVEDSLRAFSLRRR